MHTLLKSTLIQPECNLYALRNYMGLVFQVTQDEVYLF